MISTQFYYQLVVLGFLWLFGMLCWARPSACVAGRQRPANPTKPRRTRSNEPHPFAGLTQKPHCALCEQDVTHPHPPSPATRSDTADQPTPACDRHPHPLLSPPTPPPPPPPPDPIPPTNRRPRAIDTSIHFCPHATCDYRGWVGLGNLRANGHPNGGPWRKFRCTSWGGYFLETHG